MKNKIYIDYNERNEKLSYVLFFTNYRMIYRIKKSDRYKIKEHSYDPHDIFVFCECGIVEWRKGNRLVTITRPPYKFDGSETKKTLYLSQSMIDSVKYVNDSHDNDIFFISDEENWIKKYCLSLNADDNDVSLKLINDYYIHRNFKWKSSNYIITRSMLYIGSKGYLLKNKDKTNPEQVIEWSPDDPVLASQNIVNIFSTFSDEWIVFIVRDPPNSSCNIVQLPEYSNSCTMIIKTQINSQLKFYHYFYDDEDYLIYYFQGNSYKEGIHIEIRKKSGELHQTLVLHFYKIQNQSYPKISLSPNGRYIFYWEQEDGSNLRNFNNDDYSKPPNTPSLGKICELVKEKGTDQFDMKEVRTFDDFTKRYGFRAFHFNNQYQGWDFQHWPYPQGESDSLDESDFQYEPNP